MINYKIFVQYNNSTAETYFTSIYIFSFFLYYDIIYNFYLLPNRISYTYNFGSQKNLTFEYSTFFHEGFIIIEQLYIGD